ncbi:MAG: carbohydrate kinase family protein [Patescibacteria group bacterium]|nr:carbohydrate kinase family protein [Patescibacteria group bacterium]
MKFDVVTFGSAFVDVYLSSDDFKSMCKVEGGKWTIKNQVITTGGGATNVAVGFERLGLQTAAVCCVGKDDWGLFVRKELKKEGVSLIYVQQVDEPTSYSTILVDKDGGRSALIYRKASNRLAWHKVNWDKLSPEWFYISSLGGDLTMLTKIIRVAQDRKIKVALNPGSKEIEAYDKLIQFLPHVDVLLVNREEAAKLTKHKVGNLDAIYKDISKFGAKVIAITNGRRGAVVFQEGEMVKMPAEKSKAVEETGAGDAFGCGLVAGLVKGFELKKALKMGLKNGAAVVEHFGPKKGLLFETEMGSILKK